MGDFVTNVIEEGMYIPLKKFKVQNSNDYYMIILQYREKYSLPPGEGAVSDIILCQVRFKSSFKKYYNRINMNRNLLEIKILFKIFQLTLWCSKNAEPGKHCSRRSASLLTIKQDPSFSMVFLQVNKNT